MTRETIFTLNLIVLWYYMPKKLMIHYYTVVSS